MFDRHPSDTPPRLNLFVRETLLHRCSKLNLLLIKDRQSNTESGFIVGYIASYLLTIATVRFPFCVSCYPVCQPLET